MTLSNFMTTQQVLTPAQCHPMGDSGGRHGDRVSLRSEQGGEPTEREQGARALSHPGVCGEYGGGRGLHAVLHQWYDTHIQRANRGEASLSLWGRYLIYNIRHTNTQTH